MLSLIAMLRPANGPPFCLTGSGLIHEYGEGRPQDAEVLAPALSREHARIN